MTLAVGLVALCFTSLFLARTRLIAGPQVQALLEREASRRGVDLYVASMRPVGLLGVRLERVRGRVRRGPYVMDTRVSTLDVSPDVWASLRQGRPVPGTVTLNEAHVTLSRRPDLPPEPGAPPAEPAPGPAQELGLESLHVVGRDVTVELRAGEAMVSTRPLRLARLEATLPLRGAPLPTSVSAYGELPDGVPFTMSTRERASGPGYEIVLAPREPTHIDAWFDGQLPFEMTASGVTLCSQCERDVIDLGAVELRLPNLGQRAVCDGPTGSAGLERGQGRARARWGRGARAARPEHRDRAGAHALSVRLGPGRAHRGAGGARGAPRGHARAELAVRQPGAAVERGRPGRALLAAPAARLARHRPASPGRRGQRALGATADVRARLLELNADVTLLEAQAQAPMLTGEPLQIPSLRVRGEAVADLVGRALSVRRLEVGLGRVRPIKLRGQLVSARSGWRFEARALGRDIEAEALRRALPERITRPVAGAELAGHFGFDVHARGHTAWPESLDLGLEVDGDVEVLRDGHAADIRALASDGVPWVPPGSGIVLPESVEQWVPYEQLPAHLPRGLIAAEDATFFRHDGFDLGGLARAMTHNLTVGRMERGGSTITQQLIKNLYLSHDRTAVRKLQEAYLTWRIEDELSKERILEIYLNIVHWGPDLHGIHHAAAHYFGRDPRQLEVSQIALLAAILPNPDHFGGLLDAGRLASSRLTKFEHIMANLRYMGDITTEEYARMMARARQGRVGGLELTVCADDEEAPEGAPPCTRPEADL